MSTTQSINFSATNLPVAGTTIQSAQVNTTLQNLINDYNLQIGSNKIASQAVLAASIGANSAIVAPVGGVITAGIITLQCVQITLAPTAGTSTAQTNTWPTAYTTLLTTWAQIISNSANNQTFISGTDSSSNTTARVIVYNSGSNTNTVVVNVYGLGIL